MIGVRSGSAPGTGGGGERARGRRGRPPRRSSRPGRRIMSTRHQSPEVGHRERAQALQRSRVVERRAEQLARLGEELEPAARGALALVEPRLLDRQRRPGRPAAAASARPARRRRGAASCRRAGRPAAGPRRASGTPSSDFSPLLGSSGLTSSASLDIGDEDRPDAPRRRARRSRGPSGTRLPASTSSSRPRAQRATSSSLFSSSRSTTAVSARITLRTPSSRFCQQAVEVEVAERRLRDDLEVAQPRDRLFRLGARLALPREEDRAVHRERRAAREPGRERQLSAAPYSRSDSDHASVSAPRVVAAARPAAPPRPTSERACVISSKWRSSRVVVASDSGSNSAEDHRLTRAQRARRRLRRVDRRRVEHPHLAQQVFLLARRPPPPRPVGSSRRRPRARPRCTSRRASGPRAARPERASASQSSEARQAPRPPRPGSERPRQRSPMRLADGRRRRPRWGSEWPRSERRAVLEWAVKGSNLRPWD